MMGAQKKNPFAIFSRSGPWIFPAGCAAAYLILWTITPDQTLTALETAGRILMKATLPLLLAFAMMVLLNRYITPAHIIKFMGRRLGVKGILLSSVAGIISMGPIFAWYPFLKALREKGAADFYLANFLSSRAVKPILLPVLLAYFGWRFSLVFTITGIADALIIAAVVGITDRNARHLP
jgi:uncharacterized membrane protein YraQ (UPF0718 family)